MRIYTRSFTHTVTEDEASNGMSIKKLMDIHFDFSSRLRTKIKQNDLVTVNGKKVPLWIPPEAGDVICITLPQETSDFEPEPIPLDIVYEDEDIMAINKQPHLVVHPTYGFNEGTVAHGLSYLMQERGEAFKIRFINRLDMDTSGILLIAKNAYAQDAYTKAQRDGLVSKRYEAIVSGHVEDDEGLIDAPIGHIDPAGPHRGVVEGGKPSKTRYRVIERLGSGERAATLVELELLTGRTHQIRVHMKHIGHTLLGDEFYDGDLSMIKRQALHAKYLSFPHPVTKDPVEISCPLPDDMQELICTLRELR